MNEIEAWRFMALVGLLAGMIWLLNRWDARHEAWVERRRRNALKRKAQRRARRHAQFGFDPLEGRAQRRPPVGIFQAGASWAEPGLVDPADLAPPRALERPPAQAPAPRPVLSAEDEALIEADREIRRLMADLQTARNMLRACATAAADGQDLLNRGRWPEVFERLKVVCALASEGVDA